MKPLVIAATLISVLTAPALAQTNKYHVVKNKQTGKCSIALSAPTETEKFSMMGIYGSEANAKMAMKGMRDCK